MQSTKLIGSSPLVTSCVHIFRFNNLNSLYQQTLRWKRKPIWLPTAKSKVFRVPKRPEIPKDEFLEIQRLYNNYRTYYRSVRKYFIQTVQENEVQFNPLVLEKAEEEDYNTSYKINEEWNKKIAKERDERLNLEREAQKLKILETLERKKIKEEQIKLNVDKKVKNLEMLTPTFITRENLDVMLNEILNTTVDYNQAIDSKGNWMKDPNDLNESDKKVTQNQT